MQRKDTRFPSTVRFPETRRKLVLIGLSAAMLTGAALAGSTPNIDAWADDAGAKTVLVGSKTATSGQSDSRAAFAIPNAAANANGLPLPGGRIGQGFTLVGADGELVSDIPTPTSIQPAATPVGKTLAYTGRPQVGVDESRGYKLSGEVVGTSVGSYVAWATLQPNYYWADGYPDVSRQVTWSIGTGRYDMSGVIFENATVAYDRQAHDIEVSGALPEGLKVSYSCEPDVPGGAVEAGTYVFRASFTSDDIEDGNYEPVPDMTAVLTITPVNISEKAQLGEIRNYRYIGSPIVPRLSVTLADPWEEELVEYSDYRLSYENNVNVGTATVRVNFIGNYAGTKSTTFQIEKARATITADDAQKVYGDSDPELSATVTGVVLEDELDYTVSREPGEEVGTYAINATLGSGAVNDNYDVTLVPGVFTVTSEGTIALPEGRHLAYDGTEQVGVEPPEHCTITGNVAKDAGEHTAMVTPDTGWAWADGGSGTRSVTWWIDKASAFVLVNDAQKLYGDPDPSFSASVNGVAEGDILDYTIGREPGEDPGTYPITATPGSSSVNDNYNIYWHTGTLTIHDMDAVPVPVGKSLIYNGSEQTGIEDGVGYVIDDPAQARGTDAGSYHTSVSLLSGYVWADGFPEKTRDIAWSISPARYDMSDVSFDDVVLTWDGQMHEVGSVQGQLPEGVSVSYDGPEGGANDAGTYVYTARFSSAQIDAGNYEPIPDMKAILVINPLDISESAQAVALRDYTYQGAPIRPDVEVTVGEGSSAIVLGEGDYRVGYGDRIGAGLSSATLRFSGNFTGSKTVEFRILKAPATVIANDGQKAWGEPDGELTASAQGLVAGERLDYTVRRAPGEDVGTYSVEAVPGDGVVNENYDIDWRSGTFTITPTGTLALPTGKTLVYDGGQQTGVDPIGHCTLANSKAKDAGSYTATATPDAGWVWADGTTETKDVAWSILKAKAYVAADDAQKVFGAADPELSASVYGAVSGDVLDYRLERGQGEFLGTYNIDVVPGDGAVNANYDVTTSPAVFTILFWDVPQDAWFYDDVRYVSGNDIMKGYEDDSGAPTGFFGPADTMDRSMVVTVLWRMAGSPKEAPSRVFSDVTDSDLWFYDAVAWAVNHGVTTGYGGTDLFGPYDQVTREQFAAFLFRYGAYEGLDVSARADLSRFSDQASIDDFALDALSWAVASKVVNGYAGTDLIGPVDDAERAQAAAMLHRFDLLS